MPQLSTQEQALVDCLRRRAAELPAGARSTAEMLNSYVAKLEAGANASSDLIEFEAFAAHYKGLKDTVVPGVSEVDWTATVNELRKLARFAVRAKGLDKSLFGRLHRLLNAI